MKKQIALIEITELGADVALYLNGEYIISADPACGDSTEMVEQAAQNLACLHGVEVTRIPYAPCKEWQWNDIQEALQAAGTLAGGLREYQLQHRVIDREGEQDSRIMALHAADYSHALEQLIDAYKDDPDCLLWVENPPEEEAPVLFQNNDSDYHLRPELGGSCWITVGNASVYIKQEGEGVVVDIFPLAGEADPSVASTYAFYSDCLPEPC